MISASQAISPTSINKFFLERIMATPARHQLMFLHIPQDTDFTDTVDDQPYVFEFEATDNPLDNDDPEAALAAYYKRTFN